MSLSPGGIVLAVVVFGSCCCRWAALAVPTAPGRVQRRNSSQADSRGRGTQVAAGLPQRCSMVAQFWSRQWLAQTLPAAQFASFVQVLVSVVVSIGQWLGALIAGQVDPAGGGAFSCA